MSTHDTAESDRAPLRGRAASARHHLRHRPRRRRSPSFTVASGIVPRAHGVGRRQRRSPARCSAASPAPLQVAFYTRHPGAARLRRVRSSPTGCKNWERGGPDNRRDHRRRTSSGASRDFRAGVYMQTLLRDPAAGIMHSLIYFGFLVLLGVTTVLEIDHQLPESLKFLHGRIYQALLASSATSPALVFLVGIVWAIVRRYVQRPVPHPHQDQARARRHPRRVLRASASPASSPRCSASPSRARPTFEKWSFIGYPLAHAGRRLGARHARHAGTRSCGSSHVVGVLRLPRRSCRSRCCATCSRRR